MDVRSGDVKAMVGGYDFERSEFNRSTQALRQVGSAFKVVVYSAALEQGGFTPATSVLDAPVTFGSTDSDQTWSPRNYDRAFMGPITLRRALERSRNVPAVRTLDRIGIETGIQYARRLGLTGPLPPYLPIALGAGEATLMEMTAAFATFPNQGLRMTPRLIRRIEDRDGDTIEETRPQATEAVRADTAYLMTNMLRGVVERGTAVRARSLERPIGGKTGTTNDWTDGWFLGFEPDLCAGVWVGFDEKKNSLGRGQDGGRTALPIWMDFWKVARADAEVQEYDTPGNIVFVPVDGSGQPARRGSPGSRLEAFVAGTEPRATFGPSAAGGR
jgi:penicillin-binding protein 1A